MENTNNSLKEYFPEKHGLIVRYCTTDCDLNEMCRDFEELAQLLRKNSGPNSSERTAEYQALARTFELLRLEICVHLEKLK